MILTKNKGEGNNMLFKGAGYDEFLAQKIYQGLRDIKNGKYLTEEQFKQEMEQLLIQKESELQQLEGNVIYG